MGSGQSKPSKGKGKSRGKDKKSHQNQPAVNISGPTGGPVMVPPVYRDTQGMPITHMSFDLDRATIFQALENMAAFLMQRGVLINIVTVGGAVNTLYLQSRNSTHDVDFFLANPESPQNSVIHEAARHANRLTNGALGGDWFNNSTQVMMGRSIQQRLAETAFQQRNIVFERVSNNAGLIMFAAPWSYAFCGKLNNRLCEVNRRPYDINDAVIYLYEYLRQAGKTRIGARIVFHWCDDFRKNVTEDVLREVDKAYTRRYGTSAIDWAA